MSSAPATTPRSLALLDDAVHYTSQALGAVTDDDLDARTPCARWSLSDLLRHMDDSLAAFTEAAELGRIDLEPRPCDASPTDLVDRLRGRACDMLEVWHSRVEEIVGGPQVSIGIAALQHGVVAGIGALEITVHGWDVARAIGLEHPVPEPLALALLDVAEDVVGQPDRHGRFAPVVPTDSSDPAERLLAFLGR